MKATGLYLLHQVIIHMMGIQKKKVKWKTQFFNLIHGKKLVKTDPNTIYVIEDVLLLLVLIAISCKSTTNETATYNQKKEKQWSPW